MPKPVNQRKRWIILICLFCTMSIPQAGADSNIQLDPAPTTGLVDLNFVKLETDLAFSAGYRRDELDWNIAGFLYGKYVNVLSELEWDELESYEIKFRGSLAIPDIIALRGSANYGWIFDGQAQDSDYDGDNRTNEWSRSNSCADDGDVWDVSLAFGYPFKWGKSVISTFTPLLGYSYHEQNLTMTDGYQTISEPIVRPPSLIYIVPEVGEFSKNLDNTYETQWEGPWIGFDLNFRAAKIKTFAHRFETFFSYEYHWADYYAEADWNLRTVYQHPKSFTHDANGNGWIFRAGFNLVLQQAIALNLNFDYQDWSTDSGTDKIFFADGTTAKTRLNEVNWTSYSLGLGVSITF